MRVVACRSVRPSLTRSSNEAVLGSKLKRTPLPALLSLCLQGGVAGHCHIMGNRLIAGPEGKNPYQQQYDEQD